MKNCFFESLINKIAIPLFLFPMLLFAQDETQLFELSQNSSDTISLKNKLIGYVYYKNNVKLSFEQVMLEVGSNPKAYKLMKISNNMQNAGYIFAIAGISSLGFSLGYALICEIYRNKINKTLFFTTFGSGLGFIGVGISFEIGSSILAKKGITIFNNSIKQRNNTNLDLGISPNGIMLRLNF
jgi:hypothetical protein